MFTIHVIHTSHTDLGYTDTQEKMAAHHVGFIREALELCDRDPDFRWSIESYLCMDRFLREADEGEKEKLLAMIRSGRIAVSGSYLNLTDLIPAEVQHATMERCAQDWERMGISVTCAMTADINGYAWGFGDVLYEHGVSHLMSSIHTHHGYHPLMCKQTAFRWITPKGNRLLVWNGDHYNLGCELGIAQTGSFEYTIHDGLDRSGMQPWDKAVMRIQRYVENLKEQGYPYDFVPVCVSSDMTDNAPPSLAVSDFIRRYNSLNTGIELRNSTLDVFFEELDRAEVPVPEYRGDWTDWWADGVASTPKEVIQYRRACRNLAICSCMDPQHTLADEATWASSVENLMLYGEHTWGYSSSITEPFHPQVTNLNQWKGLYALKAAESTTILREKLQQRLGETPVSVEKELKFRAVNPHGIPVHDMLVQDLEQFYGHRRFRVVCEETGEKTAFQLSRYSRGPEMCLDVVLGAGETKTYRLEECETDSCASAGRLAERGIEGVDDLSWHLEKEYQDGYATEFGMENAFFRVCFERGIGITEILDKRSQRNLVDRAQSYAAFTPIYEVTPKRPDDDPLTVRRNMGRNRKAFRTERTAGELKDVRVLENGPLYSRSELVYELPGTQYCSVVLTLYHRMPRIGVDLKLHKASVWEPENVYIALPYCAEEIWLDKAGAVMRPRVDQLPGTCTDFYAVQNGLVFTNEQGSLLFACQDAPMVTMGELEAHPIRLMGENVRNRDAVYSWVMNNFWETNFNVCLAGYYTFHYDLLLSDKTDPDAAFSELRALNEGILQFYRFDGSRVYPPRL